jgi:hypothetical protein
MIVAHVMGLPIEETVLPLVPTAAVVVTAVAVAARLRLRRVRGQLWRR